MLGVSVECENSLRQTVPNLDSVHGRLLTSSLLFVVLTEERRRQAAESEAAREAAAAVNVGWDYQDDMAGKAGT